MTETSGPEAAGACKGLREPAYFTVRLLTFLRNIIIFPFFCELGLSSLAALPRKAPTGDCTAGFAAAGALGGARCCRDSS